MAAPRLNITISRHLSESIDRAHLENKSAYLTEVLEKHLHHVRMAYSCAMDAKLSPTDILAAIDALNGHMPMGGLYLTPWGQDIGLALEETASFNTLLESWCIEADHWKAVCSRVKASDGLARALWDLSRAYLDGHGWLADRLKRGA